MAQVTRKMTTPDAQKPQNSPGSRSSRTQGGGSSWSPNSSPKPINHDDHGNPNHHHKKSVLMKVKEKARKLKKSLSSKKRRDDSPYSTPPAGPYEPEYFGSPLHESKAAPGPDKPTAKEHSREISSEKQNTTTSNIDQKTDEPPNTTATANTSPETTDSKLSALTFSTGKHDSGKPESNSGEKENVQTRDKGVSVKEYLMQKFEPGEDERALSQVIQETISPRRGRMREAMSSFLRTDEPSDSSQNVAASSSAEPPNLNSSLSNDPSSSSHGLEPSLSNASNTSLMSSSVAASSNLKLNPGSNQCSSSSRVHTSDNATRAQAWISNHEGSSI